MHSTGNLFPPFPPPLDSPVSSPFKHPPVFDEECVPSNTADGNGRRLSHALKTRITSAVFEAQGSQTFDSFDLDPALLKGIYSVMQFDKPSAIQALSLPLICQPPYHSLIAQAHNGSGKTCCFVLCILSRLDYSLNAPQALVLVPTRELAIQNESVLRRIGSFTKATVLASSSAEDIRRSVSRITDMVVVSTIGTLQRWRQRAMMPFKDLKVVVFDEADVMVEREDFGDHSLMMMLMIDREAKLPQILLFSATYNEKVRLYVERLFNTFKRPSVQKIYVPNEELSLDTISQVNVLCNGYREKVRIITERIFPFCESGKIIVFVHTRRTAAELHQILTGENWSVTAISGDMDFYSRDRVVQEFRNSVTSILVSTDVLARGFDVFDVNVVINFDVPTHYETYEPCYETYLHRVGRSGRFRRAGAAFNLVNVHRYDAFERSVMDKIAQYFDREIPYVDVDDDEAMMAFMQQAGVLSHYADES